jgi:hypothetical protein
MVVGVPQRVADPADPDAGQGGLGYLVLADHHVIGREDVDNASGPASLILR